MDQNIFKVCVQCMTFNHASYIEDCMNGFTMQQTTFPYICCILDDASTDGAPGVVCKYVKENFNLNDPSVVRKEETDDYVLWFAQHKTNRNCYFAIFFLKYNHFSIKKDKMSYIAEWLSNAKYISICEGDDYWILPSKIQKQVDFLEKNPDYVLVHTDYVITNKNKSKFQNHGSSHYKISEGWVAETLFEKCWIRTLTICYRNIPHVFDVILPPNVFGGDIFMFFMLAQRGKFHFINEESGVYRKLSNSASHSSSENKRWEFSASLRALDYFMADYMKVGETIRDALDAKWFEKDFKHALRACDYSYYRNISIKKTKNIPNRVKLLSSLCKIKPFFIILSTLISVKNLCKSSL